MSDDIKVAFLVSGGDPNWTPRTPMFFAPVVDELPPMPAGGRPKKVRAPITCAYEPCGKEHMPYDSRARFCSRRCGSLQRHIDSAATTIRARAIAAGLKPATVRARLCKGMTVEQALAIPAASPTERRWGGVHVPRRQNPQ